MAVITKEEHQEAAARLHNVRITRHKNKDDMVQYRDAILFCLVLLLAIFIEPLLDVLNLWDILSIPSITLIALIYSYGVWWLWSQLKAAEDI